MSREQLQYEQGWDACRRCRTRRPLATLERSGGQLVCRDRDWCDRMVLWNEEQEALRKASRPRGRPRSR